MWQLGSAAMSRGWQQAKREQDSQCPDLICRPIWTRYKPIWTHKGPCGTLWVRPGPFLRGETILESFTFWNFHLFHQNHGVFKHDGFLFIKAALWEDPFQTIPNAIKLTNGTMLTDNGRLLKNDPVKTTCLDLRRKTNPSCIIYGKRKEQLPDSLRLFFFFLLRRP